MENRLQKGEDNSGDYAMRKLFSKRRAAWRKGVRSKAVEEKKVTNLGVCFVCYWGSRRGRSQSCLYISIDPCTFWILNQ